MAQFIKPAEGRLTSFYGRRIHPITKKWSGHHGVDIAKSGTVPVKATASGTVRWARSDGLGGTYGNVVVISHAGHWESLYAHLARYTVRTGQHVKQGQVIGYMGNTGGSTGQHLHFELHKGGWNANYTNEVNPLSYYQDPDVKSLQEKLNFVGIEVAIDSYFGPATEKAVRIYQSRKGLEVDGSAGPATMVSLNKTVADKQASTASKPKPPKKEVIPLAEQKNAQPSASLEREVALAKEAGITDGTYLHRTATREEVAAMNYRVYDKLKKEMEQLKK